MMPQFLLYSYFIQLPGGGQATLQNACMGRSGRGSQLWPQRHSLQAALHRGGSKDTPVTSARLFAPVFQLALEKGSANQAGRPVLAIPVHFHMVWLLSSYSGKVEELHWTIRPAKLKLLIVNHFSRTYSTVADYRDSGTELDHFHGEEKPS